MLTGGRERSVFQTLDLKSALALAIALERANMGLLMLQDNLSGQLYPALAHGMSSQEGSEFGMHRPGIGPLGIAFTERRTVTVQCTDTLEPSLRRPMERLNCARMAAIPLAVDTSGVLGLLVLLHRDGKQAPAGPLVLLYASVLATALENVGHREAAEHARERAEVRSHAKTQFLARIGHELRSPLQSVIGYLDLLQQDDSITLSAHHTDLLERATQSTSRMLDVLDDLLSFSRVEAGQVRYNLRRVSLADAMAMAEIVVAPIASSNRVSLLVEASPRAFARADFGKLNQILINLLTNAVRVTPPGGTVRMRAEKAAGRPRFVTVSVSDSGPGIARDEVRRLFEPYVHAGLPAVDGFGGTGLGLPISREFAAGMGGELDVSSDGKGSTFFLRLPRDRITRGPRGGAGPGDVGLKANGVTLQPRERSKRGAGSLAAVAGSTVVRALDKPRGTAQDRSA